MNVFRKFEGNTVEVVKQKKGCDDVETVRVYLPW